MPAIFVHVSDIHFGQETGETVHIHDDIKEQLIDDARNFISNMSNKTVCGILVTGDIAHSGVSAQYEAAGQWLDQLASSIGVESHRVQMVPGNHDLDRSKLSLSAKLLLERIRDEGAEVYEEILQNPIDRAALFSRFEDYSRFSNAYKCPLNSEGKYASDMVVPLAPGRSIRFIRFNSALLCSGEEQDEYPELIIGAGQFIIPRENGVENVILVHHPLRWYKDELKVKNYIRNRARVFISGHEHNPQVIIEQVEEGCDILMLAAGATVPFRSNDKYTYTYNIIEFDWDEATDGLLVTIHPREWSSKHTRFESGNKSLGGNDSKICLQSPFFRKASESEVVGNECSPILVESSNEIIPADVVKTICSDQGEDNMWLSDEKYERIRFRFFRDLYEGERLRILVELGALPHNFDEQMNQGLEGRLLEILVEDGKLDQVEMMIIEIIDARTHGVK